MDVASWESRAPHFRAIATAASRRSGATLRWTARANDPAGCCACAWARALPVAGSLLGSVAAHQRGARQFA